VRSRRSKVPRAPRRGVLRSPAWTVASFLSSPGATTRRLHSLPCTFPAPTQILTTSPQASPPQPRGDLRTAVCRATRPRFKEGPAARSRGRGDCSGWSRWSSSPVVGVRGCGKLQPVVRAAAHGPRGDPAHRQWARRRASCQRGTRASARGRQQQSRHAGWSSPDGRGAATWTRR
jgi:hypothetical protein